MGVVDKTADRFVVLLYASYSLATSMSECRVHLVCITWCSRAIVIKISSVSTLLCQLHLAMFDHCNVPYHMPRSACFSRSRLAPIIRRESPFLHPPNPLLPLHDINFIED